MNNNHMTESLLDALRLELEIKNRHIHSRANRYHMSVLEKEILDHRQSVVFVYKLTDKYAFMELCCPLTGPQHEALAKSKHAPLLRSGTYLKLRLATAQRKFYAASSIRFPLEEGGIDFVMAMDFMRVELEKLLRVLESGKIVWECADGG